MLIFRDLFMIHVFHRGVVDSVDRYQLLFKIITEDKSFFFRDLGILLYMCIIIERMCWFVYNRIVGGLARLFRIGVIARKGS